MRTFEEARAYSHSRPEVSSAKGTSASAALRSKFVLANPSLTVQTRVAGGSEQTHHRPSRRFDRSLWNLPISIPASSTPTEARNFLLTPMSNF